MKICLQEVQSAHPVNCTDLVGWAGQNNAVPFLNGRGQERKPGEFTIFHGLCTASSEHECSCLDGAAETYVSLKWEGGGGHGVVGSVEPNLVLC